MKTTGSATVDEYLAGFEGEKLKKLQQLRQIIRDHAPEAEESISYQMPAYKYLGRPLVYFGGFKNHVSLFAAGSQTIAKKFARELEGYIQSKGAIQFPLDRPLPKALIVKIVKERVKESSSKKIAPQA